MAGVSGRLLLVIGVFCMFYLPSADSGADAKRRRTNIFNFGGQCLRNRYDFDTEFELNQTRPSTKP